MARAWVDFGYRRRLLEEPEAALAELGYPLIGSFQAGGTRKHRRVCTTSCVYPVLLLSDLVARPAARLVQELCLSVESGR